ncbi:MAG TPA: LysE family translocator [Dongiaceae bacterium]|jgi:threonine/homoserine/homoserine lactone efflux protein|nr:LysE family translocator [Dongiaceae bacterium]
MDLGSILLFVATLAIAIATPGPTIATLIARILTMGPARNIGFAVGLILGDVLWLAAAVFGLAALATEAHEIVVVLKYLGAAYLIYLAYKMWTAPAADPMRSAPGRTLRLGSIAGGLAMAVSNPKTMLFYLALLPNLVPLSNIGAATFAELVVLLTIVYVAVLAAYMTSASYARRLIASPRTLRYANRGSAIVMTGTAAIVATRS